MVLLICNRRALAAWYLVAKALSSCAVPVIPRYGVHLHMVYMVNEETAGTGSSVVDQQRVIVIALHPSLTGFEKVCQQQPRIGNGRESRQ